MDGPAHLRDEELLARIAARGPEQRAAEDEFYRRHVRYLYGSLLKHCRGGLERTAHDVEDLVQDTFRRAFERAETFRGDEKLDDDRSRRRARAWLGRIARNLLVDALGKEHEVLAGPQLDLVAAPERRSDPPDPSSRLALLEEAIRTLSDREQDVLRVTATYLRAGAAAHQRLPNAVSQELARRWATTNDNVRAIRSRALKRVHRYLESHGRATASEVEA